MDGTDVGRRMLRSRNEAIGRVRLAVLWRRRQPDLSGTAADCLKLGKEPLRPLEPLRRGQGADRTHRG